MRRAIPKNDAITVAAARSQLKSLLVSARSLDVFTPESLHRSYRVPLKEIEYELVMERQRREARG